MWLFLLPTTLKFNIHPFVSVTGLVNNQLAPLKKEKANINKINIGPFFL